MKTIATLSAMLGACALVLAPPALAEDQIPSSTNQESSVTSQEAVQPFPTPSRMLDQPAAQQPERAEVVAIEPHILKASEVIGYSVQNLEGQGLGIIKELVIDPQSGQVIYAALSTGGFLGMGDKLFTIPWKALKLRPEQQSFSVDITKDALENVPGFDKDDWPSSANRIGMNVP